MAKFLSYDGIDKNGIRAEVMVQTGTGRIKNITGRGKELPDGSYRNVEVEFDPDNPKLHLKVYALLDTTAKELWDYVQEAHLSKKDISYRIESQRRRNVDRKLKFEDLKHSEQVVRVLAGIDNVFSHEAKTSPTEDPDSEAPSALNSGNGNMGMNSSNILGQLANARKQGLPENIIDALSALALAQGVEPKLVMSAGYDQQQNTRSAAVSSNSRAVEEKPWNFTNTDGRINAGSYAVAHAATAERFSLDHLVTLYSVGKKVSVTVNDDMIAQAASLAVTILDLADKVQERVVGRVDRQKNSYNRALSLILEGIEKRYPAPVGGGAEDIATWKETLRVEASERFIGILMVANGHVPTVEDIKSWQGESPSSESPKVEVGDNSAAPTVQAPAEVPVASPPAASDTLKTVLDAVEVPATPESVETSLSSSFVAPVGLPQEGEDGFIAPAASDIELLRDLCVEANIVDNPKAISDWLERNLGVRSARKAHAELVGAFLDYYTAAGSEQVRNEVLGAKTSAA